MNIHADIAKIASELERRNDQELIRVIYDILNLVDRQHMAEPDDATKKRMVDNALRSEEDIREGRFVSIEEVRARFDKRFGK